MSVQYYYEVHYALPSASNEYMHHYVLCEHDVLKFIYGASNQHIESLKFDTEEQALSASQSIDLANPKVVKCEHEF